MPRRRARERLGETAVSRPLRTAAGGCGAQRAAVAQRTEGVRAPVRYHSHAQPSSPDSTTPCNGQTAQTPYDPNMSVHGNPRLP